MKTIDRVLSLLEPMRDAGAAIDAARVLASITGNPHTLWLDLPHKRWHVRPVILSDGVWAGPLGTVSEDWDRAGGVYVAGEDRSWMQRNRDITPEKHDERACGVHSDYMASIWRSEFEAAIGM